MIDAWRKNPRTAGAAGWRAAGRTLPAALLAAALFCLAACAPTSERTWLLLTERGAGHGFTPRVFDVPPFRLAGFLKNAPAACGDLVIYLEGDGRAVSGGRPARDPSPRQAIAYALALRDPAPCVLYLARVGHYQPDQLGPRFQPYWAEKRLAEEVVAAADQAVSQVKAELSAERLHLVGYSGGGGLAVLLTERRRDVASLVTVAGLLDTRWWVTEQNYRPLTGSLNPADQAALLTDLPQLHLYGTDDRIVPPGLAAHFQTLAPFTRLSLLPVDSDHWSGWVRLWPELLQSRAAPLRTHRKY